MIANLLVGISLLVQDPAAFRRALAADADTAVARARDAQAQFERARRHRLPVRYTGGGRCDERIGRFCYWYDDGDTSMPADPPAVRQARARLLATFDATGALHPGSDWLAGQRVRYLIEQDSMAAAVDAARSCAATGWWCDALLGLALHADDRYAAANAAFDRARDAMGPALRCAWDDWTVAFDDRLAKRVRDDDCAARAALADSAFWLGQPLLTREGNDLRSEHFARRTMAALKAVSLSPHGIPWGDDMEELLLRYGWSKRYSASDWRRATLEAPSVTGHQRSPAFQFLPLAGNPDKEGPWRWDLRPDRPRARYSPPYADRFDSTDRYQIARFPRAGALVVAAAIDRPSRDGDRWSNLAVSAALSTGPDSTRTGSAGTGGVILRSAWHPAVVSVEATSGDGRGFLRHRALVDTVDRSGPLLLSDPLLFRVGERLPDSLEEAASAMLPSAVVSRREPVGVFWELTERLGDSVSVAISVVPNRRGLLGRIGQGLSLVGRRPPLTLTWDTEGPGRRTAEAVELGLAELKPGRYRLVIEVSTARARATAQRDLELVP